MDTRENLTAELMGKTMKELQAMGVTAIRYPRKADMVNQMVEVMVGRRLDSDAIERAVLDRP